MSIFDTLGPADWPRKRSSADARGMYRLIVLLCAKRSGSTAVFRMFQRHSACAIPHTDPDIDNFEPNFWNYAQLAIDGDDAPFRSRFGPDHPVIRGRVPRSAPEAFALWDEMHEAFGPVLFDKTPKLLTTTHGLDLLLAYRAQGRDVRLIALVRDPRDVVCSQYERWHRVVEGDSPRRRERAWVDAYRRLLTLRRSEPIPLFRYEDLVRAPALIAPTILACAGLHDEPDAYRHLHPVNLGRHTSPTLPELAAWSPGRAMCDLMAGFAYTIPENHEEHRLPASCPSPAQTTPGTRHTRHSCA